MAPRIISSPFFVCFDIYTYFFDGVNESLIVFTGRRRWTSGVSRWWIFRISRIGVMGLWMRQDRRARCVRKSVIVYRLDQSNHQRKQLVILTRKYVDMEKKRKKWKLPNLVRIQIKFIDYIFIYYLFCICFCEFNKDDENNIFLFKSKMKFHRRNL